MAAVAVLRILLGEGAQQLVQEELAALGERHAVRIACVPFRPGSQDAPVPDAEVAFFSRELWAGSTWSTPNASALEFFLSLRARPSLRWVHVFSSGSDLGLYQHVPPECRLSTSAGASAGPIAQSVLAAILWHTRGFPAFQQAQQRSAWELAAQAAPRDLQGRTALIIGTGHVGSEIARLLDAFGVRVVGVRRRPAPQPHFAAVESAAQLDGWLPRVDWLVLACPLDASTRGIVDARRLALLRPDAALLNVGRGGLLDEAALARQLEAGRLGWALLDAFDPEPLPAQSPLWRTPRLTITPHATAISDRAARRVADIFLHNLDAFLRAAALRNEVARGARQASPNHPWPKENKV